MAWMCSCATFGLMSIALLGAACASPPATTRTGFLSDYSSLERVDDHKARFVSPELRDYDAFIVDPIEMRYVQDPPLLDPKERAEVASYFLESLKKALRNVGYKLTDQPGVGVARLRLAMTNIKQGKWWASTHPGSKLAGAGTGGASMEGEVIDSGTGKQLAAVVMSGRGDQFELDHFNRVDDIKDVINKWAKEAEKRLRELRENPAGR